MRRITDSFPWELAKLLLVPVLIPLAAWLLNKDIMERGRMQSYFSQISDLAIKAQSPKNQTSKSHHGLKDSAILRSLARSQTLAVLPGLSGQSKREVIAFLANSDLHYQFSLSGADLRNANLKGLHLWHVDLRNADLRGAILDETKLQGASLRGAKFDGSTSMLSIERNYCSELPSPKGIKAYRWRTVEKKEIKDPKCKQTPGNSKTSLAPLTPPAPAPPTPLVL